jgi:hypothetical protein
VSVGVRRQRGRWIRGLRCASRCFIALQPCISSLPSRRRSQRQYVTVCSGDQALTRPACGLKVAMRCLNCGWRQVCNPQASQTLPRLWSTTRSKFPRMPVMAARRVSFEPPVAQPGWKARSLLFQHSLSLRHLTPMVTSPRPVVASFGSRGGVPTYGALVTGRSERPDGPSSRVVLCHS